MFATLTRLLVNRVEFLNKLRDYRDCRYERAGRRSCHPKANVCTLMRTCGKLQCVRITGVNCYDELLDPDIIEKSISPAAINTIIIRTTERLLLRKYSFYTQRTVEVSKNLAYKYITENKFVELAK